MSLQDLKKALGGEKILHRAKLANAKLAGASLRNTELQAANLFKADLANADLTESNLDHANLSEAKLDQACLVRANLISATIYKTRFIKADLSHANIRLVTIDRTTFSGADLTGANLSNSRLVNAAFLGWSGAILRDADLTGMHRMEVREEFKAIHQKNRLIADSEVYWNVLLTTYGVRKDDYYVDRLVRMDEFMGAIVDNTRAPDGSLVSKTNTR